MENTFMKNLSKATNFTRTENGALTHKKTESAVLDMFALGGAYRKRSDEDCVTLFKRAYEENPLLALKCLFYLRDIRGGQGERRFFRICFQWLTKEHVENASINLNIISEYGRWDDLIYSCIGTPLQEDAFEIIKNQLAIDVQCQTPSLLAKWLPSENASAKRTKTAASLIREYLNLTHKEYRKMLSALRSKINVLEKLMSQNRWDEIEFDKIPSKAGIIYRNAFARRDIIVEKYKKFIEDKKTKVNAEVLNPVDIAVKVFFPNGKIERGTLQKYWENLKDYYNGRVENGIAVVDVSGSMYDTPIAAAISMGTYIAERGKGPFANHFITFSEKPSLIEIKGTNIVDKFLKMEKADWGGNTNIEAVFDLLLSVAKKKNTKAEDIPEVLYIFSDMEFDECITKNSYDDYALRSYLDKDDILTLLEIKEEEWAEAGYKLPRVIFWNLDARQDNIPALGGRFSYVSGFSLNMIEYILSGKDGYDLMLEKLTSDRYNKIKSIH